VKSFNEKLWIIIYSIFAKNLPISYHLPLAKELRVFFAKRILKNVGINVNIEKGAVINGQASIGDYSGVGVNCELNGPVNIGNYVMMGPEVVIYTQNHATLSINLPIQLQGYDEVRPVNIGNDVWIGRRVIILPGVNIGEGSIIGAGAVVSKDIPAYSIVVGNPAKIVRNRREMKDNV
jgi:maltose O-acetyltransferase